MIDSLVCPSCDGGQLHIVGAERTVAASDGTQLKYSDSLTACDQCGERFYTHEQALASSRARAGVLREHDGLLAPDEIRSIRGQYGVSQTGMERMLRVGPKTVVRWERGTICQSAAVDTLLTVIRDNPSVAASLAASAGVELVQQAYTNPWWTFAVTSQPSAIMAAHAANITTVRTFQAIGEIQGPCEEGMELFWSLNTLAPVERSDSERSRVAEARREGRPTATSSQLVA